MVGGKGGGVGGLIKLWVNKIVKFNGNLSISLITVDIPARDV